MQNTPDPGEILLLDKPLGWSSFQALKKLKYLKKAKKAGHAGTLDPLATGLLIVCTERSTKKITGLQDLKKVYTGTICLGGATASGDLESEISETRPFNHVNESLINNTIPKFMGEIEQIPPSFSAIKVNGKRAYELARKGIDVKMKSRKVHIYDFKITAVNLPRIDFEVECSKGTYIRTLAMDFAIALGTLGHLTKLCRTAIGEYSLENAKSIDEWALFLGENQTGIKA